MAAEAVENCRLKAFQDPPDFDGEGAYGSWVLRLVIGEALSILYPDHAEAIARQEGCPPFATSKRGER
jgi:hypothetical protein